MCTHNFVNFVNVHILKIMIYFFQGGVLMAYTEAGMKAANKYKKEKMKRIPLEVSNEQYELIKAYANGRPTNTVLKEIIFEKINGIS